MFCRFTRSYLSPLIHSISIEHLLFAELLRFCLPCIQKMCIDLAQIAYVKRAGMHVVPRSTHDSFIVDVYIVWVREMNKNVVYIHHWNVCTLLNDNELIRFNASGNMCCFCLYVYHSMDCLNIFLAYTAFIVVFIVPIPRTYMIFLI